MRLKSEIVVRIPYPSYPLPSRGHRWKLTHARQTGWIPETPLSASISMLALHLVIS